VEEEGFEQRNIEQGTEEQMNIEQGTEEQESELGGRTGEKMKLTAVNTLVGVKRFSHIGWSICLNCRYENYI
jgi:hypothetical protein